MIEYTKLDNPIVKRVEEVQKGDVLRCEYGDYDNWIEFVLDKVTKESDYWYCTEGRYLNSGNPHKGYCSKGSAYYVLGHVDEKEG